MNQSINYYKDKRTVTVYINSIFFFINKQLFIIFFILLPLCIYFTIIWLAFTNEFMAPAISLIIFEIFSIFVFLAQYFHIKKNTILLFANESKIDYKLDTIEDKYLIHNLTKDKMMSFDKSDIKRVQIKKIIIIQLFNKQLVTFPRLKEIEEIFTKK